MAAQDGINNDALLIDDCNGNPAPHHWLGDGYCDDGECALQAKTQRSLLAVPAQCI